jgi:ribonuclease HI
MLSPTILFHYTVTPDPIDPALRGQAQSVALQGRTRDGLTPLPCRLLNVYLATGDDHHKRRAAQLKSLLRIPKDMHLVMGGDFNFVENAADATDFSSYHRLKNGAAKSWRKLITKHGLWEVGQDTHTHIALNHDSPRTSRIDRFYITHNEADTALFTPETHVTNTPHSILNTIAHNTHPTSPHISAHMALTLQFHSTDTHHKHQDYRLPPWVPRTVAFQNIFKQLWEELPENLDPYAAEVSFKRTAKRAHQIFKKDKATSDGVGQTTACELQASVHLLRAMSTRGNRTAEATIRHRYPDHFSDTPEGPQGIKFLRERISKILEGGDPGPALTSHHRLDSDKSDGAAVFRTAAAPRQVTDKITHTLPSTKTPLTTLRAKITDDITTDPPKQAKIIKNFWGGTWARRPNAPPLSEINDYLHFYQKRIPDIARPSFPTLAKVKLFIKRPRNTSPGPDGMPFSLYSSLCDIAAPLILAIIIKMSTGAPPPKEFNFGGLCIFPKDGSSTIDRTRPITLNNTSNRLIASIIADCIMPAIDAIADKRQKGFIRGRRGEDNIREMTGSFYDKLNKQQQHYFLFIDTAKAFDSLDHAYLFAVLDKIGMPSWVVNIIRGLMTNVRVRPVLKGRIRITIPILRGVKQGCPLSPLLFIIAYDPFLTKVGAFPGATTWSFADDAVLSHDSLDGIHTFTKAIDAFSAISGFGVNREKCIVLHVLEASDEETIRLDQIGWDRLAFTNQAVYLGILVGYGISTVDIFQKAYDKFKTRAGTFACALRFLPPQARVKIFNRHILPLLSYVTRFYILPHKELGDKIRNIMRRQIISFNGGAYKFSHLSTPTNRFGPTTPLRDLWASNVAALACQFDFDSIQIIDSKAVLPGKLYINDDGPEWNTLLVGDHIACAALSFLNEIIPKIDGNPDLKPLDVSRYKHPQKRLRKKLYDIAMTVYEPDILDDLHIKLYRMNMTTNPAPDITPAQSFTLHARNICPRLPAHIRDHQRHLIFNALATDIRRRRSNPPPPRGPPHNPHPCFLCGVGPDEISHIYGSCTPAQAARKLFGRRIGVPLKNDPKHYGLTCRAAPTQDREDTTSKPLHTYARRTNATIIFNHAIWHCRSTYYSTIQTRETHTQIEQRIADIATMHWNKHTPAHWHTTRDRTRPDPAIIDSTNFGSAGKRTPTQKAAARQYGQLLIASIPPTSHIAYTDGSAQRSGKGKGMRGPCGAGARLIPPQAIGNRPAIDAIGPLGKGTNNIGELFAVGMALDMFLLNSEEGDSLHIFSDSKLSTLLIEHGAHAKANTELVRAVRSKYWLVKATRKVRMHWLPAHVGIRGNEDADVFADEGARLSSIGAGYTQAQMAQRLRDRRFYGGVGTARPRLDLFGRLLPPDHPSTSRKRPAPGSDRSHSGKRSRHTPPTTNTSPAPSGTTYKQGRLWAPTPSATPTRPKPLSRPADSPPASSGSKRARTHHASPL